jgi:hypothetical protein
MWDPNPMFDSIDETDVPAKTKSKARRKTQARRGKKATIPAR